MAFSRWPMERCFEEPKGDVGLTHWESRVWLRLQRHLILTSVSDLFLARAWWRLAEENPEVTICPVSSAPSAVVQSWWLDERAARELFQWTARRIRYQQRRRWRSRGGW